jgi:L-aminopeptidase/D-esterase-like protein
MATGTRELDVLSPRHLVDRVNAVLLTGGSAFGLAAADGVMEWLEEEGEGFDTGVATIPIVPAAVIFDLAPNVARPGREEGRRAAEHASRNPVPEGRVGAGAGATVGKLLGSDASSPGGIGSTARGWKSVGTVGVLAVVNALGDVVAEDGTVLAGVCGPDGGRPRSDGIAVDGLSPPGPMPGTNTTLAVIATDLPLGRTDLAKLAEMASAAFPRAISPVNTPFDGDLVFALSTGDDETPLSPNEMLALGVLARTSTEEAIRRAVRFEEPRP